MACMGTMTCSMSASAAYSTAWSLNCDGRRAFNVSCSVAGAHVDLYSPVYRDDRPMPKLKTILSVPFYALLPMAAFIFSWRE